MFTGKVAVGVPAAMENLNIPHAALRQSPGIQAGGGKGTRRAGILTVELEGAVRFLTEIHQLRHAALHAVRHLVLLNAFQRTGIGQPLALRTV